MKGIYNTEPTRPLRHPDCNARSPVRHSIWTAMLTDSHFWLPVIVLLIGIAILVAVK